VKLISLQLYYAATIRPMETWYLSHGTMSWFWGYYDKILSEHWTLWKGI